MTPATWLKIEQHAISADAEFVFKSWLDAGGEISLVKDAVLAWLKIERHGTSADASFVFKSWLDAGGEISLVKDAVLAWLKIEQHATSARAQFVFNSWLNAGGEIALVKDAVLAWLKIEQHATSAEAQFVFKSWLDNKGPLHDIDAYCQAWLRSEKNLQSASTGYLIRAYGDRMKLLPPWMTAFAEKWFQVWMESPEAVYPLKYIVRIKTMQAATACSVVDWCRQFSDDADALNRFAQLGHKIAAYPDRGELIRIGVYLIACATNRVALNPGEQHGFLLLSALTCLANLDRLPLRDGGERQAATAIPLAACAVFVSVSGAEPARLDGHESAWIDALVGADWERLVKAGLSAGAPNPGQVRAGAAVWARMCLPWAMDSRTKASLTRLAALAGTAQV